jgi:MoaA/NifB/PqqE/SkfB family radical SAM enzyme
MTSHQLVSLKLLYRFIHSFFDHSQPIFAHLFVTKRCNLRCKMCNVWETKCQEVDTAHMKLIIDRLDRLGIAIIQLTGGEPFLRSDLGEIVRYTAQKGMIVQVSTNGTLPLSCYQKALTMPLKAVGVSLHSYQASAHEKINGLPGSWAKAVRTIRFLQEQGMSVYVCSVISSINLEETKDIVKFCVDELGVDIGLQPAVTGTGEVEYVFRGNNPDLSNQLEISAIEKAIQPIPLAGINRTRHFMKNAFKILAGKGPTWACEAGRLFLAVMPDGQVGLCQDILSKTNLLDGDFFEKLHSQEFRLFCENSVARCKHCVYSCYYDLHNIYQNPLAGLELWLRNRRHHKSVSNVPFD